MQHIEHLNDAHKDSRVNNHRRHILMQNVDYKSKNIKVKEMKERRKCISDHTQLDRTNSSRFFFQICLIIALYK